MKLSKKLLIIILVISMFLITNIIIAYATSTNTPQSIGLNNENFIEYVNNLYIDKEEVEYIIDKGKKVAEKVQGKFTVSDFTIKEIFSIYNDMSSIANDLNLKLNLNIKSGTFNLKENDNQNVIFHGDINKLGEYFNFYKNNINTLAKEVLGSIDNKETIKNIEEVVKKELGTSINNLSSALNVTSTESQSNKQPKPQEETINENVIINNNESAELYSEESESLTSDPQGDIDLNTNNQEKAISKDNSKDNTTYEEGNNLHKGEANNNLLSNKEKEVNSNGVVDNQVDIPKTMLYTFILPGVLFTIMVVYLKFKK